MGNHKFEKADRVIGNESKASFRGREGRIESYHARGEYWVQFADGRRECVDASWLSRTGPIRDGDHVCPMYQNKYRDLANVLCIAYEANPLTGIQIFETEDMNGRADGITTMTRFFRLVPINRAHAPLFSGKVFREDQLELATGVPTVARLEVGG